MRAVRNLRQTIANPELTPRATTTTLTRIVDELAAAYCLRNTMAASYLSKLNPVPVFPEFSGPYQVGTVDVEIPIDELESPAPAPKGTNIETVQFRIFYPIQPDTKGKKITWLPAPQRHHMAGYVKFLGAGPLLADAVS